jgi:hypothetical protein
VKRRWTLTLVLVLCTLPLSARAYLGLSQGLSSTSVEIGYMTRSFEQNLSIGLPVVEREFKTPVVQATVLYKVQHLSPLVISIGPLARLSWGKDGSTIGGGGTLSLSWETVGKHGAPFIEGAYLPWVTNLGSPEAIHQRQVEAYLRFGWRHLL